MKNENEISDAERDLRTAALNSGTSLKILKDIRDLQLAQNPRPPPSGFRDGGDFLNAIRHQMTGGGVDPRLMVAAISTFGGETVGADGGFALPPDVAEDVLFPVLGSGSLLGAFDPFPATSSLVQIAIDEVAEWGSTGVTTAIVREGGTTTASKPVMKKVNCLLHKAPALVHVSSELVADSPAAQRWAWRAIGRKVANKVEALLIAGTGQDEPLGLLNGPAVVTVAKESAQTGTIVAANVQKMLGRLLPGSFKSAIWIAHTSALPQIAGLGAGIYNADGPSPFGLGTLLGRPLAVSEYANPLASVGDLILVDPLGHLTAVKGPRQTATFEFAFDQDLESFKASVRFGCVPLLSAAVARRTGTDTLSHTVVLEAR